jgi:hypothetical protein
MLIYLLDFALLFRPSQKEAEANQIAVPASIHIFWAEWLIFPKKKSTDGTIVINKPTREKI